MYIIYINIHVYYIKSIYIVYVCVYYINNVKVILSAVTDNTPKFQPSLQQKFISCSPKSSASGLASAFHHAMIKGGFQAVFCVFDTLTSRVTTFRITAILTRKFFCGSSLKVTLIASNLIPLAHT